MADMTRQDPLALSVTEAAQLLGISVSLCKRLVASGVIPSRKLGSRRLIPRLAVESMLNNPKE